MPQQSGLEASRDIPPSVSIVLATNRNSPYLAETLRSVTQQTVDAWDLLVVDNGAPDIGELRRLVDSDPRMRLVTIDASATVGTARNVGVALTAGPLVTYLDDDDVWAEDRLEKHLAAHARNPEAPASFSGYWHLDSDGRHFGVDWRSRSTSAAEILSGRADTPVGGTLMVRRGDYLAIGGFSPEIPILVDFEFALRLALRGDLIYIDELLVGYRRHSANMTSTAPDNARRRRRVMEQMVDRQRWAAVGRGDTTTAAYFEERLARFRRYEARAAGSAVFRSARRGLLGDALEQSVWALSRAPLTFVSAAAYAPVTKARKVVRRA